MHQTTRSSWTSFGGFLIFLLIFQTIQPLRVLGGPHNSRQYSERLSRTVSSAKLPADKRTLTSGSGLGGSAGQPEEIFSASDQLESNYDEYPMVVPKRAALLLDRLMVALHHALEREHGGSAKLSEFYNKENKNYKNIPNEVNERNKEDDNSNEDNNRGDDKNSPYLAMYSDDDPTVMMDYDFKDLNSINRATGETLMAQSFQRRANMGLDLGSSMGVEGVSSLLDTSPSSALSRGLLNGYNSGDISGVVGVGGGRTSSSYWRCYFNAVSCF